MKTINYEFVKEVVKELRKRFKGMSAHSYGHCCRSDYDMYHKNVNDDDYVQAVIYKGGLNNDYDSRNGGFKMHDSVVFRWGLTEYTLDDVITVMREVADKWGYVVVKPENESKCIEVSTKEKHLSKIGG